VGVEDGKESRCPCCSPTHRLLLPRRRGGSLAEALEALPQAGSGRVARVESGHELRLVDGRQIRLAGVLAPLSDPKDASVDGLARAARRALAALAEDGELKIRLAAAEPDRYGRLRAHLLRTDTKLWLQAALLRGGHVRVFTTPETARAAEALYAAESEARRGLRGLWAHADFRAVPAERVARPPGRYTIVVGRVREAAKVGGTLYLNFGQDWRSDFTLRLRWPARRRFPPAQREAEWWTGRELEMRGMLESYNGPMITASHPAQIRLLEAPPRASSTTDTESRAAGERPD